MRSLFWQRYQVTVVAMIIYGVVTSFATIIYEILLAGATTEQWLGVRLIYNVLRFAGLPQCLDYAGVPKDYDNHRSVVPS